MKILTCSGKYDTTVCELNELSVTDIKIQGMY